jgi:SPOR domain
MADNFRSRDPRPGASSARDDLGDPLAELARLIGQRAPRSADSSDAVHESERYDDTPAGSELEWVAGDQMYAEPARDAHDAYASHPPDGVAYDGDDRDQAYDEPPPARQYAGPPPAFDDAPDHGERRLPAFEAPPPRYEPPSEDDDAAHEEHERDSRSPRRSGTILILAVLGLAVLGTAGALGYRAMFGGSMVPGFPPLIKPADGPIKVQPSQEKQADKPGQSQTANQGAGERLVEHQEQPVDVQSANPPVPRVVNTIPVISNAPMAPVPGAPPPAELNPPAPPPQQAAVPPAGQAPPPAIANPPAQPGPAAPGAKQVHTVIIRPGQPANANANPAPAAAPPAAHAAKPLESAPRQPRQSAAGGGPLSIVPSPEGDVQGRAPERTHVATRTPAPAPLPPEATSVGAGGYAVQVSSQRSEAEAEAAFHALQAKYPQELGGRQPIVRRADLGAKGVYYRAMVGPFASGEQATELCSKLKAAGASCIIQRN